MREKKINGNAEQEESYQTINRLRKQGGIAKASPAIFRFNTCLQTVSHKAKSSVSNNLVGVDDLIEPVAGYVDGETNFKVRNRQKAKLKRMERRPIILIGTYLMTYFSFAISLNC
mmetsp:Transcript_14057/g.15235  ORF Transcript_14057/g.15235 Transcript_14057/m.15235 type:complete len:115 (+) Transcript_14057:103-447(+)